MLDVLVASSAVGLGPCLERGEQLLLGLEVLEDGLDNDIGARYAVAGDVGNEAVQRVSHAQWILEPVRKEFRRAPHRG